LEVLGYELWYVEIDDVMFTKFTFL
jgi:hypothetical protein